MFREKTTYVQDIDGQVRLVRLQVDYFRLYDEQTVNGLRIIA
jgi:hypothetical protein